MTNIVIWNGSPFFTKGLTFWGYNQPLPGKNQGGITDEDYDT